MPPRRRQIFRLIYWLVVVGLFSFAVWRRFSLPLDPIADPDTWGYLAPALQKLTGSNFGYEGRNFVYPGFLFLLLRVFGDFRAITIAQHLLGLAAGGLLLLTWRQARAFVARPRLSPGSHDTLGLIAVAIFLFAGDPVRTEMEIRPEGVCAFVLSLNLWLAFRFIEGAFVAKRPPSAALGTGLVLTAILLASLKPSFLFVALISVLPVGFSFLRPGPSLPKIRLAVGAGAGALLLIAPEYLLSRNDYRSRMFLPTTLFVVHADMIRDQMADDLEHSATIPYQREWLSRVRAELSEEMEKSVPAKRGHYSSFGFSPDYLMYEKKSMAVRLAFEFENDPAALTAFYRFYYWRTWQQRPIAMLEKVVRQMAIFYAPMCPAYDRSKFMLLTDEYRLGVSSLNGHGYPDVWQRYPPAVEFMSRTDSLAQDARPLIQPRLLRRALTFLGRTYLPLLLFSLVVAAAILLRQTLRPRVGWLAALTLFVFSYNAAACLEVAILNSLEVARYVWVQMFFTLLAEFLAIWLLLELVIQRRSGATVSPG
jgi:hypothetical protein